MRENLQTYLVCIVCSSALSVGFLWLSDRSAPASIRSPQQERAMAPAPSSRLEREVARLSGQVRDLAASHEAIDEELDALATEETPADDERSEVEVEASIDRTLAFYDDQLAGQVSDPSWAPKAEAEIEARVAGWQTPGLSDLNVECRASLCRVEVVYDPAQVDPNALADALGSVAPWPANAFFHVDLDTDHVATTYLARGGVSLPRPG